MSAVQRCAARGTVGEIGGGMTTGHETVVHMLVEAAARAPAHPALVCGDEVVSYAEYAACVAALAHELAGLGGPGARIALLMSNSPDIAIATFAAQAAGAQVMPLNPGFTAHELIPILADAAPAVLIHNLAIDAMARELAEASGIAHCIAVGEGGRRLTRPARTASGPLPLPLPDQLSTLQYTGGTTGRPKGVDLSHRAVAINVAQREALLPTEAERERILAITPLYHVYAVSMGLYLAANCRGTLVILPRYRPEVVLEEVARHRITLLSGSPTIFTGLMAHENFAATDLSSLRLCFSGTAALSEQTLRQWEAATGCPICEGYGQSEAGPVVSFNPRHGLRKVGSVGLAVPDTEVQIVDTETGTRVLPAGEPGEIRVRGPQLMRGYRNLPRESAEALRDGWLYTGDIGAMDGDGYLFIRDRKKDMAIVSGYNVYPREVEEVFYRHDAVLEAAVVGVPDAYRGEVLVGHVVLRPGVSATVDILREHLARHLAKYKIPHDIRIVTALPKTAVGKIDKKQLRPAVGAG
ncbi:MAG: long-chain fatty acid--CoA ligase [Xanthobacteraceae bacterium]|nr:MAG: long-chain fatty acid--CoA ligase [Xanthobacteraceae bacterium]